MDSFFDLYKFNNKIAIIDENYNKYTYLELNNMVREFGNFLPTKRKSLLIIKAKNTIEALVGYLGGIASGNAVLLIDNFVNNDFLKNIIDVYSPEYIWQPVTGKEKAIHQLLDYELLKYDYPTQQPISKNLSLVMLTSGSTGSPKGVRLTKNNIIANAKAISEYLELDDSERAITSLPMSYVYGLSVLNSHLYVGATILLNTASIVQKKFWDFFKKCNGTSIAGVPYTYEMLKSLRFFNMKLPSLRYMTQAGGRLNENLVKEFAEGFRENGIKFYVMYGQTEATARISYLPPAFNLSKSKSIGVAIPNGELYIVDNAGQKVLTAYKEGMLYYEGPNVMLGYAYSRGDLAKADEQKGCLNTNDLAYFDDENFFYITGRNSRFIKISGKRINLDEVERCLQQNGYNCICGGQDEQLVIAVTDNLIIKKIKEFVIKRLKISYENIKIFYINEFDKNPSGKIKYKQIFQKIMEGNM